MLSLAIIIFTKIGFEEKWVREVYYHYSLTHFSSKPSFVKIIIASLNNISHFAISFRYFVSRLRIPKLDPILLFDKTGWFTKYTSFTSYFRVWFCQDLLKIAHIWASGNTFEFTEKIVNLAISDEIWAKTKPGRKKTTPLENPVFDSLQQANATFDCFAIFGICSLYHGANTR